MFFLGDDDRVLFAARLRLPFLMTLRLVLLFNLLLLVLILVHEVVRFLMQLGLLERGDLLFIVLRACRLLE